MLLIPRSNKEEIGMEVLAARILPKFKVNSIDGGGMSMMLIVTSEVVQWQRYHVGKVSAEIPCITHAPTKKKEERERKKVGGKRAGGFEDGGIIYN
ncbi:hypothetical protein GOBAR_DD21893 [Gossypium barbadense]|nr:hypothetical protein GOBAR_DD21893 [Gossypium barbadense]